jgi:hypothetical protein
MKHDITHALLSLRPGAQWTCVGEAYSGLTWLDPEQEMPTEAEIAAKIVELDAAEPMKLLRTERDKRLAEVDWRVIRAASTGVALSKEWKDYMQSLRDLPSDSTPTLGIDGRLDMSSVIWPDKPE